ncbi:IS1 family transposase [Entomomonas moraniae]|uniref:IS1 family transposase n=1 Tax=Entomomonas moraniae TaxID=2213226 RepID=A0A3S9XBR8_9GAMM|nr:IS1 family transposase [Entomomonas moraniae]AZS49748.1 IS1 family transposase [Entomomonas moraniae]
MDQPKYYNLVPQDLHPELDAMLHYLDTYPFEKPSDCPHCGSKKLSDNGTNPTSEIMNYRCLDCYKGFNQLTGTCFAKSTFAHMHKWGDFARLRLSGEGIHAISVTLGMSTQGATKRDQRIKNLMQQQYPKLFAWWQIRQDWQELSLSPLIQQQADTFTQWLENLLNQTFATCPNCSKPHCKKLKQTHRPQFHCHRCNTSFNLLRNTEFHLVHYPELWLDYAKLLVQGYSDKDISNQLNIGQSLSNYWRHRFIKQMIEQGHEELVQWLIWQRKRNYNQKSQQIWEEKAKQAPLKNHNKSK